MSLKGKTIACFLALPHHTRFFLPLQEEIKRRGGDMLFVVTLSEYPFELDLAKRKLSYRYFSDYIADDLKEQIEACKLELLDNWVRNCFKWDGFSRWPLYKQSWFFESIVDEYFSIQRFVQVEKPDMFIAHHECNRWGQVIGHICNKEHLPFITFQEGDYHGNYIGFPLHTQYSNVGLLWGEKTRSVLRRYKCSDDKMILIGNTHIENAVKTFTEPHLQDDTRKALNIPAGKKVLLFFIDIKYAGVAKQEIWWGLLNELRALDNKDFVLVFKWHPSVYKHSFDQIKTIFEELLPGAILIDTYDPYRLIAISDYCVTFGKTTLAIEALAFGKPLFALPTIDTGENYYADIGVAQSVSRGNWRSLFDTLKEGVPPAVQTNVDKYLTEYFYKLDGKSVERAIDIMEYVLEVHRQSTQTPKPHKDTRAVKAVDGRVSFIVPSGNDPEALLATLTSLSQNAKLDDWEVIVVTNDDEIKQALASGISGDLTVVTEETGGLGRLYNRGAREASGQYLVFLTPGILYFKAENLLETMDGAVCGMPIRNTDMSPDCLGIGFDFNFTPYRVAAESDQVDAVGGGFLALSRSTFFSLGGFDADLANHLIEPDICLRAHESDVPVKLLSDCLAFRYKPTFFGDDVSDEAWSNRARFFAKWVGRLPKDEDLIRFAADLFKV